MNPVQRHEDITVCHMWSGFDSLFDPADSRLLSPLATSPPPRDSLPKMIGCYCHGAGFHIPSPTWLHPGSSATKRWVLQRLRHKKFSCSDLFCGCLIFFCDFFYILNRIKLLNLSIKVITNHQRLTYDAIQVQSTVQGTVAWDFLVSVFFINQHLLGP
jgi:hypothetical protein